MNLTSLSESVLKKPSVLSPTQGDSKLERSNLPETIRDSITVCIESEDAGQIEHPQRETHITVSHFFE